MKESMFSHKTFWAFLLTPTLLLAGLAALGVVCSGAGNTKIYFYSTEANINNFKSLKMVPAIPWKQPKDCGTVGANIRLNRYLNLNTYLL